MMLGAFARAFARGGGLWYFFLSAILDRARLDRLERFFADENEKEKLR